MRAVIVTGATGYIGRNLVEKMTALGWYVHAITRPTSDQSALVTRNSAVTSHIYDGTYASLENIFAVANADTVFHTAAQASYAHSPAVLEPMLDANLKFGSYLLEAMHNTGIRNFINTGTYWQHFAGESYNPVCLYAAQKQAFEAIIDYYVKALNFNAITLKLFDVYGPGDTRPKLFNLFKKAVDTGIPLDMSPGEQLVDFIYIDDVIDAYIKAAEYINHFRAPQHEIFFVGTGQPDSLKNIAELYTAISGKPVPINWGKRAYREREVMCPWRGKTLPGWQPKINIETGIRRLLTL